MTRGFDSLTPGCLIFCESPGALPVRQAKQIRRWKCGVKIAEKMSDRVAEPETAKKESGKEIPMQVPGGF